MRVMDRSFRDCTSEMRPALGPYSAGERKRRIDFFGGRRTNLASTAPAATPGAWRGASRDRVQSRGRLRGSGARWLPACSTPRHPNASGDRAGRLARKNRRPRTGDERCQARGTTPLRGRVQRPPLPARRADDGARCGGSLTGAGSPCRAPAAAYWGALFAPVRSGARRSCSPAFLVPLRSNRGSLARFRRVLVLVIASVFGCERTLAVIKQPVNVSI